MKSRIRLFHPQFRLRNVRVDTDLANEVGKGRFGKVFRFHGETVIKVVDKHSVIEEKMIVQVIAEKENHSICSHNDHVIDLTDSWQSDLHLYFVYPLCNENLLKLLQRINSLDDPTIIEVMKQLVSGINFMHDMGIVHRDVKLENVLVSPDGQLKLSDFGFSKKLSKRDRTRTICGTLQYMAPEIANEVPYHHSVDWWSLGVLVYRLAFHAFPYEKGKTHQEMRNKIQFYADQKHANDLINTFLHDSLEKDECERQSAMKRCHEHLKTVQSSINFCKL